MVLPYCTLTSNPYFFDSKESFPPVHTENTKMKCKNLRGRSRIFLGGVHHYFNTNKPHSFFAEYKLNYKAASHLRGGGWCSPLVPSPQIPPEPTVLFSVKSHGSIIWLIKSFQLQITPPSVLKKPLIISFCSSLRKSQYTHQRFGLSYRQKR